jgi:hypothetical protein
MRSQDRAGEFRCASKLERLDAYYTGKTSYQYGVFDEVTGKCIGTVNIDRYIGKRRVARAVQLFDKRYTGSFDAHAECVAFLKGVEAVLNATSVNVMPNHMPEVKECEALAKPAA